MEVYEKLTKQIEKLDYWLYKEDVYNKPKSEEYYKSYYFYNLKAK